MTLFISLGGFTVGRLASLYGFDDPGYAKNPTAEQVSIWPPSALVSTLASALKTSQTVSAGSRWRSGDRLRRQWHQVRLAGRADTLDAFGIQLQAQAKFGSGTTVFAAADYADNGAGGDGFSAPSS